MQLIENLINVLFPKVCAGCNAFLLSNEDVICTVCRHEIPLTNHYLNPENEAFKKFYGKVPIEFASTLVYYHKKGIVQEMIHSLKYRGHEEIGTVLGQWHADDLNKLPITSTFDTIIPVPLHKKRLRERGYNQVTRFGQALSENLKIEYNPSILKRNVYSKTQVKKNLLNRTEIIESLFEADFTEKDHNKHFLLIDDVITTGSTLEACSRALLKIPGSKISIVCMAMSHS
ncbi:ComF family protein [Flavobacterium myungsuense]|uniref:ComF family protein n=1 Tax=Flavobacterium myungsuense TaxID=651823 RepID=A0ABW3IZV2_9FLAO